MMPPFGTSDENQNQLSLGYDQLNLQNIDLDSILGVEKKKHDLRKHRQGAEHFGAKQTADAKYCLIHGQGLVGGACGEKMQFTITVVSEHGQVMNMTSTRVGVHISGLSLLSKAFPEPRPWIEDRRDGTYLVQFTCATPGQYHINAYVNGALLPMCPITTTVMPGPASPLHCEVVGDGTRSCMAGACVEFMIKARDQFGNACAQGSHRFGVRAVGHAKLHQVADNEDGTYSVTYSVPDYVQGDVSLEVLLNGVPIKESPIRPDIIRPKAASKPKPRATGETGMWHESDHQDRLQWLLEKAPTEIPEMPNIPDGIFGHTAYHDAAMLHHGSTDAAAARLAWRAADEWRRLKELREEMTRAREQLIDHQNVLAQAAAGVQQQYLAAREGQRDVHMDREEIQLMEGRLLRLRETASRQGSPAHSPSPRGRAGSPFTPPADVQLPATVLEPIAGSPQPAPLGLGGGLQDAWQGAAMRSPSPVAVFEPAFQAPPSPAATSPRTPRGASPEELGQANRRLFRAFATCTINTAAAVGAGASTKAGRMGLGLQDFQRLLSASQIRLPQSEAEDAFNQTIRRYGGSQSAKGEKTLAFELFVELLVETARKRFGAQAGDAESTATLFEEHLLPLARQLSSLEGGSNPRAPTAFR
jgi:hypothetical protein